MLADENQWQYKMSSDLFSFLSNYGRLGQETEENFSRHLMRFLKSAFDYNGQRRLVDLRKIDIVVKEVARDFKNAQVF